MSLDLKLLNKRVSQLSADLGKSVLHQLYPKDFEYYMMALELVDGKGSTIDYFAFPVLPSDITKVENKRISVRKAFKSTLVLTSSAFTPQDITIRGNFGRGFKILVGQREILNGIAFSASMSNGVFDLSQLSSKSLVSPSNQFNRFVKTGYGAIKILQSLLHKSDGSDQNGPFRLYLYNFALGESYFVIVPSKALTLTQNEREMNMIWNYNLNLTIVAPLDLVVQTFSSLSNRKLLGVNVIQNSINKVGRDISNYVLSTVG